MKQNILLITILMLLIGFWIYKNRTDARSFAKISPIEAKNLLDSQKGVVLLDVRTRAEYKKQHIPSSILIPWDAIEREAGRKIKDKNAAIIVYCASGSRSAKAARILSGLGYTNIYNLGGLFKWPYETVSGKP
jgi:Rhodanese-related sulfurtransferase